jgi:N-acetylmuramoyl-L-alanine amidase
MVAVVISSGHGRYVSGAVGILNEVDEARRVVKRVADFFEELDVAVKEFHDDTSKTQNENLKRIVGYHNAQTRDLDVSVHFNSNGSTSGPLGTECLYVTQQSLAGRIADGISEVSGLKDRGPKKRSDLYFLNNTEMPAVLIEVCFVTSATDANLYDKHFEEICASIAETISGKRLAPVRPPPEAVQPLPPEPGVLPLITITVDPPGSARVEVIGAASDEIGGADV